ncbi:MAG TPA: phosphoenolpyruvate synthase [Actinobacteria bacterium]|nr:phosphoenolpyruvate synthase [Actinomycetota bacterium]
MVTLPHLARPLTALRGSDRPAVGGKAATLGELTAAGIPVPPGFVVTTDAYEHAMQALDPDGAIGRRVGRLDPADAAGIAEVTTRVRERILAAPLPAGVREAIAACYRALPGQEPAGAPVAVRSSATSEDSESASFAGLQDTYLWVQGEDAVAGHVRRCWASLYSVESVTYRRHQNVPEHGLAMGVVVQVMVDPRCAGVLFTRSPVTGDTSVTVVEASWGLGSALVSGDVTPDSYVVSKVTGEIVKRTVASKLRHHQRDAAGGGVCLRDVPPELREVPCLTDTEVLALADLGHRVSEHYGSPQDIEWAITGTGAGLGIVLLQSRPETVWSHRPATPVAAPKARAFDHVLERLGVPGGTSR